MKYEKIFPWNFIEILRLENNDDEPKTKTIYEEVKYTTPVKSLGSAREFGVFYENSLLFIK